jgi:hypothetical protein
MDEKAESVDYFKTNETINYTSLLSIVDKVASEHDCTVEKTVFITLSIKKDDREVLRIDKFKKNYPSKEIAYLTNNVEQLEDESVKHRLAYLISEHGNGGRKNDCRRKESDDSYHPGFGRSDD